MSTLCSSDVTSHLLLTLFLDILSLFSFLTSHPLCLAYLFLLTPHIFPILSFLFPLLLSTSLLILFTLLISSPCSDTLFSTPPHLPSNAFRAILDILKDKLDGVDMAPCSQVIECLLGDALILWELEEPSLVCADRRSPEEETAQDDILGGLGATNVAELEYKVVFEKSENPASDLGVSEVPGETAARNVVGCLICAYRKSPEEETEQDEILGSLGATNAAELEYKVAEDVSDLGVSEVSGEMVARNVVGCLNCADRKSPEEETEQDEILSSLGATNAAELEYKVAEDVSDLGVSEVSGEVVARNVVGCLSRSASTRATTKKEHMRTASVGGLRRDGSMRKEKEWSRTLACKIYEERITLKLCEEKGGEDMDSLWEAYEDDANKNESNPKEKKKEKKEEVYEDDDTVQKLCCLQAFRLSAGKMNLGVGGPNLAKVSKVLKGIGLFQKVSMRCKSSRKK